MESTTQNIDKQGEAQMNQILLLKTTMDLVPNLVEALSSAESGRLKKIKMVPIDLTKLDFTGLNLKCFGFVVLF